jgi:hypothetical protein
MAARLEGGGGGMASGWASPHLALGLGGDGWLLTVSVPMAARRLSSCPRPL